MRCRCTGHARVCKRRGRFQLRLRLAQALELAQAQALEFTHIERVGPDLRVLAQAPGRDRF